jgi:SAM-dependent methyltransferase
MSLKEQMDGIYAGMPPKDIPWNLEEPPGLLVKALEEGRIRPCKAVDLGCGAGNYTVWLASMGFEVTGIDISPEAIRLAEALAGEKGVSCRFVAADLTGDLSEFHQAFDLAFDWEVLHHVFPDQRPAYADNVRRILRPGGKYLSLCFSEDDPWLQDQGKIRETRLGTRLYFSSEAELRELFEPRFHIGELRSVEIPGKFGKHVAVAAFLERR